jgi:6-phosphogluconolactonase
VLSRRTFAGLLTSITVPPGLSWSQGRGINRKTVLYSGVGREFSRYEVDLEAATLLKRDTIELKSKVQYAWPHPSRRFLYVSSSNGGLGQISDQHHVAAFRMDPSSGSLQPHGAPITLQWRPIHSSVDNAGQYLLTAYNEPSGLSVHRINDDGTIGGQVRQPDSLDCGIYAHQIRVTPSNRSVILVTRGNDSTATRPEDPGSLKVYGFRNGVLTNKTSVQPGDGLGFGPRHLDFHPTRPWVYVSIERQNQIQVYKLQPDGGLSTTPLFVKDTLPHPDMHVSSAGPIHVHPNGRFVYLTNRGGWSSAPVPAAEMYDGKPVLQSTNSTVAVFSIDPETGDPTLIQTADVHGAHPRTFSFDACARMLVAGSLVPVALRQSGGIRVLPAGLSVFRMGQNGMLDYVRRYDVETGREMQWWSGLVALA